MAGIQFCRECNNMLYPRENAAAQELMFACRNCDYTEPAEDARIYVNRIITDTATKLEIVPADIVVDPTLQRSTKMTCERCHFDEVVFFQAQNNAKASSLALIFVCCNLSCGYKWVVFFQAQNNAKASSLALIFVCCNLSCGYKWVG